MIGNDISLAGLSTLGQGKGLELVSNFFYFHVEQQVHTSKRRFGEAGSNSNGQANPKPGDRIESGKGDPSWSGQQLLPQAAGPTRHLQQLSRPDFGEQHCRGKGHGVFPGLRLVLGRPPNPDGRA